MWRLTESMCLLKKTLLFINFLRKKGYHKRLSANRDILFLKSCYFSASSVGSGVTVVFTVSSVPSSSAFSVSVSSASLSGASVGSSAISSVSSSAGSRT